MVIRADRSEDRWSSIENDEDEDDSAFDQHPKRPRRGNDGDEDTDSEMPTTPQVCTSSVTITDDAELDSSLVDLVRRSQPARQNIQPTANEEDLQDHMISAAFRARQRIIENARFPGTKKELSLVGLLERFPMTRETLVITGIGFLTTDIGLWSEKSWPRIQRVQKQWRKLAKGAKRDPMQGHHTVSLDITDKPLGGYKVQSCMKTATTWATIYASKIRRPHPKTSTKRQLSD